MAVNPMSVSPLALGEVGSAVGSFSSPLSLSGLVAWYDASQITGLTNGAAVATWADLSGNGNDLTQATASLRPIYVTGGLNELPVVRFDGIDDELTIGAFNLVQPFTYVLVAKPRLSTVAVAEHVMSATNFSPSVFLGAGSPGVWSFFASSVVAGDDSDTSGNIVLAVFNGASSTLRVDGSATNGNPGGTGQATAFFLGSTNGAQWFDGDIAEAFIYDSALTAAQITQVEAYLSSKYNITVS